MKWTWTVTQKFPESGELTKKMLGAHFNLIKKPINSSIDITLKFKNKNYPATIRSLKSKNDIGYEQTHYRLICKEFGKELNSGDKLEFKSKKNSNEIMVRILKKNQKLTPKQNQRQLKLSKKEQEQEEIIKIYKQENIDYEKIIEELSSITASEEKKIKIKHKVYQRNNHTIALLKTLRDFKCQICGHRIQKEKGGYYIEAAHIKPKNQKGSETPDNILILCPNCHKEFDYGNLQIYSHTKNKIKFTLNGKPHKVILKLKPPH
jgi:predicted HNH restriction endonuclease